MAICSRVTPALQLPSTTGRILQFGTGLVASHTTTATFCSGPSFAAISARGSQPMGFRRLSRSAAARLDAGHELGLDHGDFRVQRVRQFNNKSSLPVGKLNLHPISAPRSSLGMMHGPWWATRPAAIRGARTVTLVARRPSLPSTYAGLTTLPGFRMKLGSRVALMLLVTRSATGS